MFSVLGIGHIYIVSVLGTTEKCYEGQRDYPLIIYYIYIYFLDNKLETNDTFE